jgi:Heavy metal binding domain
MQKTRAARAGLTALFLTGCAATTPPPRFSAVGPADAEAPEAATPPAAPNLTGGRDASGPEPPGATARPAGGHEGHAAPPPAPADAEYSCRMHPEVKQASPGTCPKCGMTLIRRKDERRQP